MDGERVRNVLRLIYTGLNPEGVYYGDAVKDGLYRSYLSGFVRKVRPGARRRAAADRRGDRGESRGKMAIAALVS